jgi:glutamyl aminopeptidase
MWNSYRLPNTIIPLTYDIYVNPQIKNSLILGIINIRAIVTEKTKYIVLHSVNIKIFRAILNNNSNLQIIYNPKLEYIYLISQNDLDIGEITIYIEYQGLINDDLTGCYKTYYLDNNRKKHWVIATQFESTYARCLIPCFDEPQFKATFSLILDINNKLAAFSNMPQIQRVNIDQQNDRIIFETSPEMSTYTFAFVIGEYNSITTENKRYSIIVPPGDEDASKLALHVAIKSMKAFEDTLRLKYSLPKLDLIMVPESSAGAMENWGLVTFRPSDLLIYNNYSSESDKDYVVATISHELSHQFFGNLCTTKWWDTIWLNEGIATYFEYIGVNEAFPTWKIWDTFLFKSQQSAMYEDKFLSSHPLNNKISNNAEIDEMFDTITYDKGGSIMYMIADIIGINILYQGLHNYLNSCAYSNGTPELLWNNIETVAGRPIGNLMKTWTDQAGFPLITVEEYPNGIILKQERYLSYIEKSTSTNNQLWWISTRIALADGNQIRVEFNTKKSDLIPIDIKWYKINYNQSTFIRVNYPVDTWYRIISNPHLDLRDRAGLINDALTLSLDGKLSINVALYIVYTILSKEREYSVWMSALDLLYKLAILFNDHECEKYFQSYMLSLIKPVFNWIWNLDVALDHSQIMLRSKLLSAGIYFDDPNIIKICENLFIQWLNDPLSVPVDIKDAVFRNAIENMDNIAYNIIFRLYLSEINVIQKKRYLNALTYSQSSDLLNNLLNLSIDSSIVEPQNRISLIINIALNPYGNKLAWNFIKQHWNIFDIRGEPFQDLIEVVLENFHTNDDYNNAKEFFENHPNVTKLSVNRALETIRYNMTWRSLYINEACNWLKQNFS